ncbi:uncharacterized protein LOC116045014 [Sander lucioperca]|uniref:uncharacterized protein LOC116045014 n=1 Tax=Sander lucioperca TaxID=283035 RepID=UPI001653E4A0|nr:uncharacterized protein LOC116045014 [Sander lucioperca]
MLISQLTTKVKLDLVCCTDITPYNLAGAEFPVSDHKVLLFEVHTPIFKVKEQWTISFRKVKHINSTDLITLVNFHPSPPASSSPADLVNHYNDCLSTSLDALAPPKDILCPYCSLVHQAVTEIAAVRVHGAPPTPQPSVRFRKMEAEIRIHRVGEGKPTQAKRRLNKEICLWFNCTKTGGWYVFFFPLCLCSSSLVVYDIKHTHCDYYYDARFGPGTKLTVLDSNRTITPPKVKVLQPSPNECQTNKDRKHKKTLVCVASHFYPDHVSVFWQIDGVNVTRGVATDDAALWGGEHYSISSRLTVPHSDWFTPSKTFTCTVSFFNGNYTVPRSDWVQGVKEPAGPTRGKYLSITHTAKLFYAILIAKSSVFGVFVVFLVWRLQGSSGKQKD